jgi:putative phosphoribosyl transferase
MRPSPRTALQTGAGRFTDRHAAGRELAERLSSLAMADPVVLGLARGGVPVAYEVAQALRAPLDVLVVRKIGAPGNPEYGLGAIAEGGARVLDRDAVRRLLVSVEELEASIARAVAEVDARVRRYRRTRPPLEVAGRTAIVVDDGLATGGTARAALLDGEPADPPPRPALRSRHVRIPFAEIVGDLALPEPASGLVVFAHGSGSSRFSPRNRQVAGALNERGLATLLLDLLRRDEERDRARVFDIALLTSRLLAATRWTRTEPDLVGLPIGYFGASTGAAAAISAAAEIGDGIAAVVSRGGRPDLAAGALPAVTAPVLLIVGTADPLVLELNREAREHLRGHSELATVTGATHLFEEPGALEEVARLAGTWFERYLTPAADRAA